MDWPACRIRTASFVMKGFPKVLIRLDIHSYEAGKKMLSS